MIFSFQDIDRSINAAQAEIAHENTLLPDTPIRVLQRVLSIYRGVRPLLSAFAKVPFLPPSWSGVIDGFLRALDALAAIDLATFKAGKDL